MRWARLNPATFRYGNGGVVIQGDDFSSLATDRVGFLTKYVTSGIEEDKAEMFAHMMIEFAVVAERASTDQVVQRKLTAMRELLESFCAENYDAVWTRVRARGDFARCVGRRSCATPVASVGRRLSRLARVPDRRCQVTYRICTVVIIVYGDNLAVGADDGAYVPDVASAGIVAQGRRLDHVLPRSELSRA